MELTFALPDVGEGIDGADVVEWRVREGDAVAEDQPLVEIQTDKAIVEIPCPTSGTVVRLCAAEGDRVAVGQPLAVFAAADGSPATTAAGPPAAGAAAPDGPAAPPLAPPAAAAAATRPLASPAVRRLAREHGIDLATLRGSGPHGRIAREDVLAATAGGAGRGSGAADAGSVALPASSAAAPAEPRPGEIVPLRGVRRSIAHTLTAAWQQVPHVIDYREVDATRLVAARAALKAAAQARGDEELARALTVTPLLVKIAALALRRHPYVNASIDLDRDEITLHAHCHVGVATAAPDGLVVPVVHDADARSTHEIASEIAVLASAARGRRLTPRHLSGGTFTVNNYGGLGIWLGTPIVVPPQVANLGVGRLRDQAVVVDGQIVVRPIVPLAVSADHRVLDGDTLAAFVSDVVAAMEDPHLLLGDLR